MKLKLFLAAVAVLVSCSSLSVTSSRVVQRKAHQAQQAQQVNQQVRPLSSKRRIQNPLFIQAPRVLQSKPQQQTLDQFAKPLKALKTQSALGARTNNRRGAMKPRAAVQKSLRKQQQSRRGKKQSSARVVPMSYGSYMNDRSYSKDYYHRGYGSESYGGYGDMTYGGGNGKVMYPDDYADDYGYDGGYGDGYDHNYDGGYDSGYSGGYNEYSSGYDGGSYEGYNSGMSNGYGKSYGNNNNGYKSSGYDNNDYNSYDNNDYNSYGNNDYNGGYKNGYSGGYNNGYSGSNRYGSYNSYH